MRRRMKFLSLAFATVVALLPANVFASDFRLRVEDISGLGQALPGGGVNHGFGVVLTDGGSGDQAAPTDWIQVNLQPLSPAVSWNLTMGTDKSQFIDPSNPVAGLRLTSFNVVSSGAATIRITLEDTGFLNAGSGPLELHSRLVGTFCGQDQAGVAAPCDSVGAVTVSGASWANTSGAVPSLGADTAGSYPLSPGYLSEIGANVGESTDALDLTASNSSTSAVCYSIEDGGGCDPNFSATDFKALEDSGPSLSLFTQLIITFTSAGSVDFSFDTTLVANEQLTPEPGTLLLIGTGLVGLALRRRALMS